MRAEGNGEHARRGEWGACMLMRVGYVHAEANGARACGGWGACMLRRMGCMHSGVRGAHAQGMGECVLR